jgi:hypothetical protein
MSSSGTSSPGLATHIRAIAASIDPTQPSNTKWNPVRDLLAEALNLTEDDVYVSTISKPGNLSVRLEQSASARVAEIVAAMYTGRPAELIRCIDAAVKHADGRVVLVFTGGPGSWVVTAIVKPRAQSVPAPLPTEYPGASVVDY